MVPAMAATGEVDRGAPVDRVEARDGGAARLVMGCGVAKEDCCVRRGHAHGGGRGWCGGGCVMMLQQADASAMGSNTPVGLSAV